MNRVVHFEIHAEDPEKLATFYRGVFGWEVRKWDAPGAGFEYWIIMTAPENYKDESKWPGINGGMVKRQGPKPQGGEPVNAFVCSLTVESVDDTIEKVEKAGGSIALPKMEIPGVGWLAYCKDPEGTIFGIMQDTSGK